MNELLEELLDGFYENPMNPREGLLIDERSQDLLAGVVLKPLAAQFWGPNHVSIDQVRALARGGGRAAMQVLVDRADRLGVTLSLNAVPMAPTPGGGKKMKRAELIRWYKTFGFKPEEPGSDYMIRAPKGAL